MPLPIRHLPVLQNWDCQSCAHCCRDYRVHVSEEERQRIMGYDWSDLAGVPPVVADGALGYRLNQRADGACVFLSDQGRCRIHERFGSAAKPFACRLYPFVLTPAGDHWRVGLRFSCPSAARNLGLPLAAKDAELRDFARELEGRGEATHVPGPLLQPRQEVSWSDLDYFLRAFLTLLQKHGEPLERRWRKCLALAKLCRQATFDKVHGARLGEFLEVVSASLDTDVPTNPATVPPPSWVGRVLFRQALAVYLRKDAGPERGPAARGRLNLLAAAWRFARGRGPVPRLNTLLTEGTFEQVETTSRPLTAEAERLFERYYVVKVEALQFFGPAHFGTGFWEGLDALALTLPVHLWLWRALGELPAEEAAMRAVRIVDHNFGYSPHLGRRLQRHSLAILARRGELEKLMAYYAL